jgi:DNA repair protein RadC
MGKIKEMQAEYGTLGASRVLRMRVLRPVFHREVIREDFPSYLPTSRFTTPRQVFEMFHDLRLEAKENFLTLHLDGKNRIIAIDKVAIGSLNQAVVHPREVFKSAVLSSAAAVLLIHNHPSGDPQPSAEDIRITRRLKECGDLLGINVLDHIVIGEGQYFSFVESGMMGCPASGG